MSKPLLAEDRTAVYPTPAPHLDAIQKAGLTIFTIGIGCAVIGVAGAGSVFPRLLFLFSFGLIGAGALCYILRTYLIVPPGIKNNNVMFSSLTHRGILGWICLVSIMSLYITMYWFPHYQKHFVAMFTWLSRLVRNRNADIYFVYGTLYTIVIFIMGTRAMVKYRHSRYQIARTSCVIFCQFVLAWLIPAILVFFKEPEKYVNYFWPLSYKDIFPDTVHYMLSSEFRLGVFLLFWSVFLSFLGVPLLTYFFGKRWYCSWVCGCGGLANTAGDPWRHLSSKKLKAWQIERWSIHSVLVLITITTALLWLGYLSGNSGFGKLAKGMSSFYGFAIGSIWAGVIGTGLYPVMGTRIWCRFGCPQAAILGLLQKWLSRYRITTNGAQCISCGNCSTYCEMGIDVRWYAQRGQNIIRASCVGCGICSAVCPRGVLNLETGPLQGRYTEAIALTGRFKSGIFISEPSS